MKERPANPLKVTRAFEAFKSSFVQMLETTPYEKITISQLIATSGYSRNAFYDNFTDKDDLVNKIVKHEQDIIEQICKETYQPGSDKTNETKLTIFRHVYQARGFYHVLFRLKIPRWTPRAFWLESARRMIKEIRRVSLPDELDMDFFVYSMLRNYEIYVDYWDSVDFKYTPEHMVEQIALFHRIDFNTDFNTIL